MRGQKGGEIMSREINEALERAYQEVEEKNVVIEGLEARIGKLEKSCKANGDMFVKATNESARRLFRAEKAESENKKLKYELGKAASISKLPKFPEVAPGRPPLLTKSQDTELRLAVLEGRPCDTKHFNYVGMWTPAVVVLFVLKAFNVNFSLRTAQRLLKELRQ